MEVCGDSKRVPNVLERQGRAHPLYAVLPRSSYVRTALTIDAM